MAMTGNQGVRRARAVLAVLAFLWATPTLWTLYATFHTADGRVGVGTLRDAWSAAPFVLYGWNTLLIVGGLLGVQLVFGSVAGYVLSRRTFRLRGLFGSLFLVQMLLPVTALVVPEYQLIKGLGLLDTRLGVALPYVTSGLAVFTFRQAFRGVPPELEEAARLDGCGALGVFRAIYLPVAWPAAIAFAIVSGSFHWTDFFWPLVVTNTDAARPLVVGLAMVAQSSEGGAQWNLIAAATFIVIAPALVLFAIGARRIMTAFTTVSW